MTPDTPPTAEERADWRDALEIARLIHRGSPAMARGAARSIYARLREQRLRMRWRLRARREEQQRARRGTP
jgi:hypothetical protein